MEISVWILYVAGSSMNWLLIRSPTMNKKGNQSATEFEGFCHMHNSRSTLYEKNFTKLYPIVCSICFQDFPTECS